MRKILIFVLMGTLLVMVTNIFGAEKETQTESPYSSNAEVLNHLSEILTRYKLDDNNIPYSIADSHKMLKDLNTLRRHISESGHGEQTISSIDHLIR